MRATVSRPSIAGIIKSISSNPKESSASSSAASAAKPSSASSTRISQLLRISSRILRLIAWSSTTSTRIPCTSAGSLRRAGWSPSPKRAVKRNVLPTPSPLSTQMRPRIISTSCCEIARPKPVPPKRREVELSTWLKESKICACLSGGMPIPVSRTEICNSTAPRNSSSIATSTSTSPSSVNLMALPTRFTTIWRRRLGSPTRRSGRSGGMWQISSRSFSDARIARVCTASPRQSRKPNSMSSSANRPASILEKSKMSLSNSSRASADCRTRFR